MQGNVAYDNEYCILDNKFRDLVTEKQGFEWVDEAKPDSYVRLPQVQCSGNGLGCSRFGHAAQAKQFRLPLLSLRVTQNTTLVRLQAPLQGLAGCSMSPVRRLTYVIHKFERAPPLSLDLRKPSPVVTHAAEPLQMPKLGYVSTVPGSTLQFTVDTSSTTQTGAADPHTVVTLSHLKSYEGMGQAGALACVADHDGRACVDHIAPAD